MGTLYYGDNLDIMRRYLKDENVDLVYLDPPFNSAQNYNAFFQEKADPPNENRCERRERKCNYRNAFNNRFGCDGWTGRRSASLKASNNASSSTSSKCLAEVTSNGIFASDV